MIGSRVLFIIVNWDDYSRDLLKIFRIWEGGLVFYGGLIGATGFAIYYTKSKGHDFFQVADILIPYVALGSMFGRIGCFAAGCCWGAVVDADFALGVQFPRESLAYASMVRSGLAAATDAFTPHVHAVQMYDACGELVLFTLLSLARGYKRFHGQIFLMFMTTYPMWRSTMETFRGDKERGTGVLGTPLSTSQFISAVIASLAIATFFYVRKRMKDREAAPPAAAASA
jgi:phosphatidylglycerol:prolipoprotein diacylglycerol transferase